MQKSSLDELIEEELKKSNGNLSRVARVLDLEYSDLVQKYRVEFETRIVTATGPEPTDIGTLGKPGWEQYVIAVKRVGNSWPFKYHNVLADARASFDAGTHEMFQTTTTDGWVVQYLYPRKTPVAPREFFSTLVVCPNVI